MSYDYDLEQSANVHWILSISCRRRNRRTGTSLCDTAGPGLSWDPPRDRVGTLPQGSFVGSRETAACLTLKDD